ncbi:MAG: hypothetical protein EON59_17690 [Alphaproteobacteria bacterium]|nr:MAG: hypothetical protein EON59_17690 [Alphaproteobacteria bacterium]
MRSARSSAFGQALLPFSDGRGVADARANLGLDAIELELRPSARACVVQIRTGHALQVAERVLVAELGEGQRPLIGRRRGLAEPPPSSSWKARKLVAKPSNLSMVDCRALDSRS